MKFQAAKSAAGMVMRSASTYFHEMRAVKSMPRKMTAKTMAVP